jgi:hypothetical protein
VIIYSVMGARVNSDVELAVGVYVVVVVDEHGSIVKRYTYLKDR